MRQSYVIKVPCDFLVERKALCTVLVPLLSPVGVVPSFPNNSLLHSPTEWSETVRVKRTTRGLWADSDLIPTLPLG